MRTAPGNMRSRSAGCAARTRNGSIPPGETPQVRTAAALLARCVRRIGARRATPAMIRELTSAIPTSLLLRLWQLTFGDRVELVLRCPRGTCGAKMDVDFTLHAVPVEACPRLPNYRVRFADGPREVGFACRALVISRRSTIRAPRPCSAGACSRSMTGAKSIGEHPRAGH